MELPEIGFDARPVFIDPARGLGRVAAALVESLLRQPGLRVVVFVSRGAHPPAPWYSSASAIVQLPQPRRAVFLWDGPVWRRVLGRHPVDVLHLPAWGVPPGIPVPVVATLHDVIPLRYPGAIPRRLVRRRAIQRYGTYARATMVHAVSRATARDAVHALGIAPDRVRVVHNGVTSVGGGEEAQRRHVLYVGGGDGHKRVGLLLEAWSSGDAEGLPPLVLAGAAAALPEAAAAAARHPGRIELAGRVDDAALDGLYRRALAVVLPSLWEGYGLPVLEGMARGAVPVVTARASLPEAGADAALYVPAGAGPRAWCAAVRRLLTDGALRTRLITRGKGLAARRSWEASARELIPIYREAVMRWRSARS